MNQQRERENKYVPKSKNYEPVSCIFGDGNYTLRLDVDRKEKISRITIGNEDGLDGKYPEVVLSKKEAEYLANSLLIFLRD